MLADGDGGRKTFSSSQDFSANEDTILKIRMFSSESVAMRFVISTSFGVNELEYDFTPAGAGFEDIELVFRKNRIH
ncbi:MAG: hypothetical protein R3204_15265, partial [Oceanospirillum sp.]|nr:hypothetical protein [Oceanospirillum sp.]